MAQEEEQMSAESNDLAGWDDYKSGDESSGQGGDRPSLFMRPKARKEPYRVRLVSHPEKFRKHFDAFKSIKKFPISPAYEMKDKDLDVAWSKGNWFPARKFACLVIDREDGRLKVLEAGPKIFDEFYNYASLTKVNPAGANGPDWIIKVTVTGKDKRGKDKTEFVCIADPTGAKPFTPEETELIEKFTFDWRGLYKKSSPEEIRDLWMQLPEEHRVNKDERPRKGAPAAADTTKTASAASAAPATPPATQPAKAEEEPPASDFAQPAEVAGGEEGGEEEPDPLF